MKYKPLPTAEELRAAFSYDPETGLLTWRATGVSAYQKPLKRGYVRVRYQKDWLSAHRVIWRMQTGLDPEELGIDHKDRNPSNNTWSNLRLATHAQNVRNRNLPRGSSGVKGVSYEKITNRWRALVGCEGKLRSVGSFGTRDEAAEAAALERSKRHGEYACDGSSQGVAFDVVLNSFRHAALKFVTALKTAEQRRSRILKQIASRKLQLSESDIGLWLSTEGVYWTDYAKHWRVYFRRNDDLMYFGQHKNLRDACNAAFLIQQFDPRV